MSVQFACGHCGKRYQGSEDCVGKRFRCDGCGEEFVVRPIPTEFPAIPQRTAARDTKRALPAKEFAPPLVQWPSAPKKHPESPPRPVTEAVEPPPASPPVSAAVYEASAVAETPFQIPFPRRKKRRRPQSHPIWQQLGATLLIFGVICLLVPLVSLAWVKMLKMANGFHLAGASLMAAGAMSLLWYARPALMRAGPAAVGIAVGGAGVIAGGAVVTALWVPPVYTLIKGPDELIMEANVAGLDEFAALFGKITDVKSAEDALPALEAWFERSIELARLSKDFPDPSTSENTKLTKYVRKLGATTKRLKEEALRLGKIPGVPEVFATLAPQFGSALAELRLELAAAKKTKIESFNDSKPPNVVLSNLHTADGRLGARVYGSLDYRFDRGKPKTDNRYFLVVRSPGRKFGTDRQVTLNEQGTIAGTDVAFTGGAESEIVLFEAPPGSVSSTQGRQISNALTFVAKTATEPAASSSSWFGPPRPPIGFRGGVPATVTVQPATTTVKKVAIGSDLNSHLAALASPDNDYRRAALEGLTRMKPAERRSDVVKAIVPFLDDKEAIVRTQAVSALAVWGDKDQIPALIKLLGDQSAGVRNAAMSALARHKDADAAQAVAQRLAVLSDRHSAGKALREMGPVAEKFVIPYLNDGSTFVRREACDVLKAIGTKESATALEAAAQDSNTFVARAAKDALQAVAARR